MITVGYLKGFVDELEKCAGLGGLAAKALKGTTQGHGILGFLHPALKGRYGWQMLAGAGAGAGIGAATDKEDRLRGMSRGALGGAALTGLGHLATSGGRAAAKNSVSTFGQRLKYQATGSGPARGSVRKAKKIGVLGQNPSEADLLAHREGWNTIPGMAKGLATKPGKLISNSWNRLDTPGKVLTGLTAADVGYQAAHPSQPGEPGRAERALGAGMGSLGYMVAPAGIIPSLAVGSLATTAGGKTGRLIDRGIAAARPTTAPAPVPQPEVGG